MTVRSPEGKRRLRTAGAGTLGALAFIAILMLSPSGITRVAVPPGPDSQSAAIGLVAHPDFVVGAPPSGQPGATPSCSPTQLCPSLLLTAYDMNSIAGSAGFNGTNQAVGIFDACGDPTIGADLAAFDTAWGLTAPPALHIIKPDVNVCTNSGWALETALDVEWAHVMAPGAVIDLFETNTSYTTDFYNAWNYAWNHTAARVFSDSWSAGADCSTGLNTEAQWLSARGTTLLAATGDGGSWGHGTAYNASQPADCPRITGVGGTILNVSGTGTYLDESGWRGSGGGYSLYAEPSWEHNVYIYNPFTSGYTGKPDVAADASPATGVLVYEAGNWYVVGGTSLATPLWAGFLADVNSWRVGILHYPLLGQINPYLYQTVYGAFGHEFDYEHGAMHDIVKGYNGHGGAHWYDATGWDPVTGIGSFEGYNLDYALSNDITA